VTVFKEQMSVGKTDFWDRAERTRSAAIERQNREQALAKEREAEEKMRVARIKRY